MSSVPHAELSAQSPQDANSKMNISEYLTYINDEWARGWIQRAKAETSGVFVSYEYMDMVNGNPYDAMLFSQVMYWHLINEKTLQPRISHKHDGHLWIVKTYKEWADELHFKSDRTIKQCFGRLADLGVVIKEKHKSPYHGGNIALYVRIDWCKFAELMKPKIDVGQTSDVLPTGGSDIKCPTGQTSDVLSDETLNVPSLPDSTSETTSSDTTTQRDGAANVITPDGNEWMRTLPGIHTVTARLANVNIKATNLAIATTVKKHGSELVLKAIEIAVMKDKRTWSFVVGCLLTFEKDRLKQENAPKPPPTMSPAEPEDPNREVVSKEELARAFDEIKAAMKKPKTDTLPGHDALDKPA